jgi:hypothetical protein
MLFSCFSNSPLVSALHKSVLKGVACSVLGAQHSGSKVSKSDDARNAWMSILWLWSIKKTKRKRNH